MTTAVARLLSVLTLKGWYLSLWVIVAELPLISSEAAL